MDIEQGIKWEIPGCADIGNRMQDFALWGDLRVWSVANFNAGYYQGWWEGSIWRERVSFNGILWTQGWSSQRKEQVFHEGIHLYRFATGAHDGIFQNYMSECINH